MPAVPATRSTTILCAAGITVLVFGWWMLGRRSDASPTIPEETRGSEIGTSSKTGSATHPVETLRVAEAGTEPDSPPQAVDCTEPEWWQCLEYSDRHQFLECLGLFQLTGDAIGRALAQGVVPEELEDELICATLESWDDHAIWNELQELVRSCGNWSHWIVLNGCLLSRLRSSTAVAQIARSIDVPSLFGNGVSRREILVAARILKLDEHSMELVRAGGLGRFGGSPEQIDTAATAFLNDRRDEGEQLRYVRDVLDSPISQECYGMGCTLAACLGSASRQPEVSLSLLLEVLDDWRFSRGAAAQVFETQTLRTLGSTQDPESLRLLLDRASLSRDKR